MEAGGLHIIGTERHDSRRIDNQLRGRAGRQGDPGSSRFYLSLDDDLMKRFASERVTGLMERLGLEDDVAIESRLVSRTIESAQSRVEGFNFDIRKRVVEFDDVINKQRETIYAERDKVLHNEDLTETVQAFLDDEIDALVDEHLVGEDPDAVEPRGPVAAADGDGPRRRRDSRRTTCGTSAAARRSREHLRELADERLATREAEVGDERLGPGRAARALRTIDSLWVEHLTELDDMRRGIGLRGYAQQDPLNEFRREAFRLYEELRGLIRHGVASSIFRVTVHAASPPGAAAWPARSPRAPRRWRAGSTDGNGAAAATAGRGGRRRRGRTALPARRSCADRCPRHPVRNVRESLGDAAASPAAMAAGSASGGARPGYTPAGDRIGRNDPCWCGSGAKYKKCHGR